MIKTRTLDLDAVQAFALVATFSSFTRAAEAIGATQSAVSFKLKRLETFLDRRLVERTPRSVTLTAEGEAFLEHAKALLAANHRALATDDGLACRLRLGLSDHAVGPELPTLVSRLYDAEPSLQLEVRTGFSQQLLEAFDEGQLDAVIVRREHGQRGGETLAEDEYAWFAAPSFRQPRQDPLPFASLAPPCGVRAIAARSFERARRAWRATFIGSGISAVSAVVTAGLAVTVLARRIAPIGVVDVGTTLGLPRLPRTKVVLCSRVSDPRARDAVRTLSAVFRKTARP